MKQRRLTQKDVAQRLEVSQAAVSGWFGKAMPQQRTLRALAALLDVTAQWLESGRGAPDSKAKSGRPRRENAIAERLERAARELSDCAAELRRNGP